jgi:Type I restriction enzyme R protein N terminus (HSDR_N)
MHRAAMEFPTYNFDSLGETDVREEIIAPLLRHLGYRSGTLNNVIREQHLTYPQLSLGRRKSTDPFLRGKADYICDAGGLVKWVIEAKAPGEALNEVVEEQAWSYANHQEIRAVYFVVTNGREFKLYQTNRGSTAGVLFECTYAEMATKLTAIENMLSPAAMLRDHPTQKLDTGNPIGPGLRSIVRVTSGQIKYAKISIPSPPFLQMIMTVTDGSVERKNDGSLEAHLWSLVPFQALQELNEKLGLDQMWLASASTVVSIDSARPTVFKSERRTILPKGVVSLNLMDWTKVEMPMNVTAVVRTRATGYLKGTVFKGDFLASIVYVELGRDLTLEGLFELHLG